jgi:hypothetical protein
MCVCVCVYMYICMCVCVYNHTNFIMKIYQRKTPILNVLIVILFVKNLTDMRLLSLTFPLSYR